MEFLSIEIYLCANYVIFLPIVGSDFEMKLDRGHTSFLEVPSHKSQPLWVPLPGNLLLLEPWRHGPQPHPVPSGGKPALPSSGLHSQPRSGLSHMAACVFVYKKP